MLNIITMSGPYGPILVILALVVLYLTLRGTGLLLSGKTADPQHLAERMNGLLFWGGVAAILGFLGQCGGTYLAVSAILQATEVSPAIIAEGFVVSFVPTLFGLGILFFSLAAWGCLRLLARRRWRGVQAGTSVLFALLLLGCSDDPDGQSGPSNITQGVWVLPGGPSDFLWDFFRTEEGMACRVHDVRHGRLYAQTPCAQISVERGEVRVAMDTGVRLEAEFTPGEDRLRGYLKYPDGAEMAVEFPWKPTHAYPSLAPRPGAKEPYAYRPPLETDDGWIPGEAGAEGVAPPALEALVRAVDQGEAGVLHAILVARNGRLILEEYFHGFGPGDLHPLASCTRSVPSLLVGLALQEGAIPGVGTPLLDFFPDLRDSAGSGWEELTLEHLLTMSMALDWSPAETQDLHGPGPEFFRQVIHRSVRGAPGRDFKYVNANVNLIAGILHRATGSHAEELASSALFRPLGIHRWDWSPLRTDGFNLMDGSLRLRPRDMAKLGQMILDGGAWRGERILDSEWVETSTSRKVDAGEGSEGYGYLWWLMEIPGPEGEALPTVSANGWGSQFIIIIPELEMVVVLTGGNEFNGMHLAPAEALARHLLPGVDMG